MKKISLLALAVTVCQLTFVAAQSDNFSRLLGPNFRPGNSYLPPIAPSRGLDPLHRWNQIAIDATGIDHTPGYGQQPGPGRSSRAMAIVHIAMFDALNAIHPHQYQGYTNVHAPHGPISEEAAIAQAAHDTLAALYPLQHTTFDTFLDQDLSHIRNGARKTNGIHLGQEVAGAILTLRTNDGSQFPEPHVGVDYFPSDQPGHWRPDPISMITVALGAHWGECVPFVLTATNQFRPPPPPLMTSDDYTVAYNEVKTLGGDGINTPTQRTEEQSFIGVYWAYDGTPSLCAPPRLYNQIVVHIADQRHVQGIQLARLLVLVNVAMADAAIGIWEAKYHYDFWRPVGGIRESDGGGPTGLGDGNPNTVGDETFSPLGAPASNLMGPNFTPPFPAYPSGHAGFGGAIFQVMRRFSGTDQITFTFVSDEWNGQTHDNQGNLRPYRPRTFSSLSQAEEENGQSRIYLGIHWSFDKTEGIALGRHVGDYVFDHSFTPLHPVEQ